MEFGSFDFGSPARIQIVIPKLNIIRLRTYEANYKQN